MFYKLEALFFIFLKCTCVWSSDLTPVLTPIVATTYLGGDVHFTCTKPDPSMEIAWDTPLLPVFFQASNKNTSDFVSGVPNVSFNNTLVSCIGRLPPNNKGSLYYSNEGKIVIQGLLSEINPIVEPDACSIHISWDPPFTLMGVPILGYNVNITDLDRNRSWGVFIVSNTYIQIPLGYDYTVSIAGVNGVGEGNISIIDINSTVLTLDEKLNINSTEISRNGSIWEIDVTVDNGIFCENNDNDSKVFFKFCQGSSESCFNASDISQTKLPDNRTVLSATVPLDENQHYNYTVIYVNGKINVSSNETSISTHDVQSIKDRNSSNGNICITINYIEGSIATGCYIKLICDQDLLTTNFSVDGYNKLYHQFWCSQNPITIDGGTTICSLEAYDKVNDTVEDENDPAVELLITISGEITASSVISDMNTPTPTLTITPGPPRNGIIIAVSITVIIIVIVIIIGVIAMITVIAIIRKKQIKVSVDLKSREQSVDKEKKLELSIRMKDIVIN